jgi:hypothetical protein
MSWAWEHSEPSRNAQTPYAQRNRKRLRELGYHDVEVKGLIVTDDGVYEASYIYELVSPKVTAEEFRANIEYLLEDYRGIPMPTDAPRKGCAVGREFPSLSKVKQLNPNLPI